MKSVHALDLVLAAGERAGSGELLGVVGGLGGGGGQRLAATADIEPGVSDQITSSLTTKKGLPAGKYRIDLLQDGKLLDTKPFEVK